MFRIQIPPLIHCNIFKNPIRPFLFPITNLYQPMLFEVTKVDLPARLRERFAALFALVGHLVGRGVDIPSIKRSRNFYFHPYDIILIL